MEIYSEEPLKFLDSLIQEKRTECELRLQERTSKQENLNTVNSKYKELSKQLQILSEENEDYILKNEKLEELNSSQARTNGKLQKEIIAASMKLQKTMMEYQVLEERDEIITQEEIILSKVHSQLEDEFKQKQSKASVLNEKLVESRKKESFYNFTAIKLKKDLLEEEAREKRCLLDYQRSEQQILNNCSISSQIENRISKLKMAIAERIQTIKGLEEVEMTGRENIILHTKKLTKMTARKKQIHEKLVQNNNIVKDQRQEQVKIVELIKDEGVKIQKLKQKEKIMKANFEKIKNNDRKLEKELDKIKEAKLYFANIQKKYHVGTQQLKENIKIKNLDIRTIGRDLALEKASAKQMKEDFFHKKEEIQNMMETILHTNNDIIITQKENKITESKILKFNNKIKELSEKYHAKINDLKSIESLLHSNLSLYESCKKEIITEL
jgi:hypothetical protein